MLRFIDSAYVGAKIKVRNFIDDIRSDEMGVSSIVATVLLILIVVLLAAVFWNTIKEWLGTLFSQITGGTSDIKTNAGEKF